MSAVSLSSVKNELKTIGCKLKSQLDGTWAIHEPKGVRVLVPTLEAAQEYYRAKAVAAVPEATLPTAVLTEPLVITHSPVAPVKPVDVVKKDSQMSEEQQLAMSAVNLFIRTMQKERLQYGLNFLHSEIRTQLLKHGCPDEWIVKAHKFTEAKLDKFCHDKMLCKRVFVNHLQKNDVMYFDGRYSHVLAQETVR